MKHFHLTTAAGYAKPYDYEYYYSFRLTFNGVPTGIEIINNDQLTINNEAGAVRYNLSGQRVGKDYKGIVVVDGKKRVMK